VPVSSCDELDQLNRIVKGGVRNLATLFTQSDFIGTTELPSVFASGESLYAGDVVAVTPAKELVQVLYRDSDCHHTVFLTNRCNSNCLMCSQPPTRGDDSWLVAEADQVARHIKSTPKTIGFTGGEPLLLGANLRRLLDIYADLHPNANIEVLTNGRLFSSDRLANEVLADRIHLATWLVPLYGHADFLHDFVVQVPGAFDETILGLLTLHRFKQPIQLRTVLIEPVLQVLPDLCEFIGRNLPFVREVALMGCEPTGFALANREHCEIDLRDWGATIKEAIHRLRRFDLPVVIMNFPLCALEMDLWQYSHQSISDWKRVFAPECAGCALKHRCPGLFESYKVGWRPTKIVPFGRN
jgi:His-Xaa-Ser system radical SAM maturase HxsC